MIFNEKTIMNHRMQTTVLVTGGAGFLGSHLCRALLEKGKKVICLDNFSTGKRENIADLLCDKNFSLVETDVKNPYDIFADEIYNLACPASPLQYQKNPIETLLTNVLGAKNALENATRYDAKILLSSTSEIYGDAKENPQNENYWGNVNPIGARSCYDEGKRAAETLFFDFHRTRGTKIKVARIFNTYGENMSKDDGRVVSNFICQALKNNDITIYGDGTQTRSFCYVKDTINGLMLLMDSSDEITGSANIGNDDERTIKNLAETVIRLTNSNSCIVYKDLPSDDPKRRRPDTTLAKKLLGFEAKVSLEEGISKTIEYFKDVCEEAL